MKHHFYIFVIGLAIIEKIDSASLNYNQTFVSTRHLRRHMEKWGRRAFVNTCCNQNCQGMFAIKLPEVSKVKHTAHDDDDNTKFAPSIEMPEKPNTPPDALKYMRRRKVRRMHKNRRFRVFTSVYLDQPVNKPANTVDLQISNFGVPAAPTKSKPPAFVSPMAQTVVMPWKTPGAPAAAPAGAKGITTVEETTTSEAGSTLDLDKMLAEADAETTPAPNDEQTSSGGHDTGGMLGGFLGGFATPPAKEEKPEGVE